MRSLSHLGKNSTWMLLSRLGAQALAVAFTVLLARQLGGQGFGEYAFIAAAIYLGNALTTFGTDMLVIREIAGTGDLSSLPAALILQLVLSAVLIGFLFLAAPMLPNQGPDAVSGLQVYSLSLIPLAFFTVFTTALRGMQDMSAYMLLNLASALMQVGAAWLATRLGGGVVQLVWLLLIVQGSSALLAGVLCTLRIPAFWQSWHFSPRKILPLGRACVPVALLTLLGLAYQKLPIYALSMLGGAVLTGWFSAALRTVEASKTLHLAVFTALYPAMVHDLPPRAGSIGRTAPWKTPFGPSWWLLLAGAAAASTALFGLARPLALILYGPGYTASILPIKILAWVLVPFCVNNFLSLSLLAARKEGAILRVQLAGLFALAALSAWWIPAWGLPGAALACLAAETVQATAYLSPYLWRHVPRLVDRLVRSAGQLFWRSG
jgi:O-antigen/teichoic acid export membrane protein